MVSIREETVIPSPPERVWPLLRDPAVVAGCIPGAEMAPDSAAGDGLWRGSIRVKFGPTVATFRGEAQLRFDDEARTCTMEGRGIDQRGASRALASGRMTLTGASESRLAIDGEFTVTGPLETFANAGGIHVARALLEEFSQNLARVVDDAAGDAAPEAAAPATAPPSPAATTEHGAGPQPDAAPRPKPARANELNGVAIFWRALKSMVAGMFGRKGG